MRTMPSKVLMSVFSLIVCAGCSVKEDRTLCPCRLVLDFSEVDTAVIRSVDQDVTTPDGFVFAENVGQSCVRVCADEARSFCRELGEVRVHLLRAESAVEADCE